MNTASTNMGHTSQVQPLRYILKHAPITTFEISVTNADGSRRSDLKPVEEQAGEDGSGKKKKKQKI